MSRLSYKTLFIILLFLLIPIVFLIRINQKANPASAGWWDETWMYRQSINISSHTSNESNVFITATIGLGSTAKTQADAGDFRFLNSTGQQLPYYVVSGAGTTAITFHIQLDSFPSGAQTLYTYYGNPSAANGFSASDFSPEATNYTLGSLGTEEIGGAPIAYWKFDEGIGTTTYEFVNNFNGGLLNGAAWQNEDQCIQGKCIFYDGTNDYTSIPNNPQLKFIGSNFSVSVWVKPVSKTNHVFVAKGQGTTRRGYQILTNSTNVVFMYSDTYDSGDHKLTGPTYNANQWMYLSLVVNKDLNQIEGFVNGNSVGTMNISTVTEDISQDYPLEIGKNNAYYAKSFIDEVKIYPYARTANQIKTDYASGLAGMGSSSDSSVNFGSSSNKFLSEGLVGYWKFDEGVGTTAIDYSGNNFTATLGGTLPTWSTGKYGVGLTFTDGSILNISTSTTFDFPSSNFALSTWIKMTSSSNLRTLFWKGNPYCDSCQGGYVLNINSGTPRFTVNFSSATGNTYYATSSTVVNDDKWHHLVGQRNGSNIEIYVDGNLSVATTIPPGSTFTDISSSMLSLSTIAYSFNGSVDEARVYNRALSSTEVKQLYQFAPGVTSKIADPIVHYRFDEGRGTLVTNWGIGGTALNSNLGTGASAPSWTNDSKLGKALSLNGAQFLSNTGTISNVQTISYWINANSTDETVMDLSNGIYIQSNGFLSGLTSVNATTYIDGVRETLASELVTNGNMESGNPPTGWYGSNGNTLSTASDERTGGTGTKSLNIVGTDQTWSAPIPGTNTTTNKLYRVTGWLKAQETYGSSAGIIIANSSFAAIANIATTSTTWQKANLHFVAPAVNYRYLTISGPISRYVRYDDISIKEITTPISANTWHHVTIVLDSPINITNLNIGKYGTKYFIGKIDEVKIYNTTLTSDQVKQDYNQNSSAVFGATTQTIGSTTINLEYCLPGDASHCALPVGEWKFDEGIGTTAYDNSDNNNHGILTNGPSWTSGKIGKALRFDGNDDYVDAGNNSLLDVDQGPFTYQAWVRSTSTTGDRNIFARRFSGTVNLWINHTATSINFWQVGLNVLSHTPNFTIGDGTWRHLAFVYDVSSTSLYINGVKVKQVSQIGVTPTDIPATTPTYIGSYTPSVYRFQGDIDQARIYNYARTPAQIAYDYNRGEPVGWWKVDECQGTLINDWSGNGNHGTLSIGASGSQNSIGTCQVGTSAAWTNGASGKLNSSISFDGNDDYATIPYSSVLSLSGSLSMSAWVKNPINTSGSKVVYGQYSNWGHRLMINNGKAYADFAQASPIILVSIIGNTDIKDNLWHHITAIYNQSTGLLYLYLDGKLDATPVTAPTSLRVHSGPEYIGSYGTTNGYFFFGQTDDVRVYNYALTPEQIKQIYNGGSITFN